MKVSDLIKEEKNWTQFRHARDKEGNPVHATDPKAEKWGILGAVERAYGGLSGFILGKIVFHINKDPWFKKYESGFKTSVEYIMFWNDHKRTTFRDVKELIKECDL